MRVHGAVLLGLIWLANAGAVVPAGTELDVRLQTGLNSGVAKLDQRFETMTLSDVRVADVVAIPAGTLLRGFVSSFRASGTLDRKGRLTLSFDEMALPSGPVKLRASVVQAIDGDQTLAGIALPSVRKSLVGVLVGDDGTMTSTEGRNVDLPVGTVLRVRVDQRIEIH